MRRTWKVLAFLAGGILTAVQLCLLANTLVLSFRVGLSGPFVGLANWDYVLGSPETWRITGASLAFAGCLLAMIPLCLTAAAGLLSVRSMQHRVLWWGLLALPLALGPVEYTAAIRWLLGPAFEQGALIYVPMAYATILHDLPLFLLVALLLDALWKPGALRMGGFLAVMGAFWALYRGFNVPFEVQSIFRAGSPEWSRMLSPYANFGVLLTELAQRDRFMNINMTLSLLSSAFTILILLPMAWIAVRMVKGMKRAGRSLRGPRRGAILLAVPALAFALAPIATYLLRLPQAVWLPSPLTHALPTLMSLAGSLLAVALGFVLMRLLTLKARVSARNAVWLCVACGVFFYPGVYTLVRQWTGEGTGFETFVPLLSAIPLFGAALILALVHRLGKRIHRPRGLVGAGLLCIGYGLGASALFDVLFIRNQAQYTIPTIQLNVQNAQAFLQVMGGTRDTVALAQAPLAPLFTLLLLALFACGVALMATAFPRHAAADRDADGGKASADL